MDINTLKPARRKRSISSVFNSGGESSSPGFSIGEGISTDILFENLRIPNCVQIGGYAGVGDGNGISAYVEVLVVQWLMDVAEELGCMSKEL